MDGLKLSRQVPTPDFHHQGGKEDANQVAAPNESRTPNWHRAKIAQLRVRMEGWRQGGLAEREKWKKLWKE
jgi:hypothetical protein